MRLTPRTLIAGLAAAAVLAVVPTAGAATYQTGGSTGMFLLAGALANKYKSLTGIRFSVAGGGSGAGISGANAGTFAIGNSSRKPKGSDAAGLNFTAISYEPILVIVNKNAKVSNLTAAQVKGIWEGDITNWSAVGGGNCTIKVYSRLAGSGTLDTFKSVFSVTSDTLSTKYASNGLIRAAVTNQPCGIGFVTYAYSVGSAAAGVKPLSIGGVRPTLQNAASGAYAYAGYQYFVTKGAPSGAVATYINWCRTSAAAKTIIQRFALVAPAGHDETT